MTAPTNTLSSKAETFISKVLDLKPQLAVFDCDGTLWSGDAGADFFFWEIERGVVPPQVAEKMLARYRGYKAGQVAEVPMCGEMVTMHQGMLVSDIRRVAEEFFLERVQERIFPEMQELTARLAEAGCEIWAVSSTNNWLIAAGVLRFGIPETRVIAATVRCNDGYATGELIRVPTDEGKAIAIREVIGRTPDTVFGNSRHDQAMLEIARHPFAINPNPDLELIARERGWTIYRP